MSNLGAAFHPLPARAVAVQFTEQTFYVEWVGCHFDFAARIIPFIARSVAVHFDAIAIRVIEINCFADQVIGKSTERRFGLDYRSVPDNKACDCGAILRGVKRPQDCKLFGTVCTPENPIGSCMVSSEGACAAYYSYGRYKDMQGMPDNQETEDTH